MVRNSLFDKANVKLSLLNIINLADEILCPAYLKVYKNVMFDIQYLSRRRPISTALLLVGYCTVGHTGATVDVEEPTILLHHSST